MEKIDTAIPLRLEAVASSYRGQGGLKPLSLSLAGGRITALLGPNGAGKSTAMRLMNGLQRPDCGTVRLWGRSPRSMAARQRLGVMLQSAALPQHLTVAELVGLVGSHYRAPLALGEIRRLAHLDAIWRQRYQALSAGQQCLVQFAQAIGGCPDLLLLDEPSVGLDMTARQHLWATVRHLADQVMAICVGLIVGITMLAVGAGLAGVSLSPPPLLGCLGLSGGGVIPFASLGMWLATLLHGQAGPGLINRVYLPMAVLSGLWFPLSLLPSWPHLLVLLGYTGLFTGLAVYRLQTRG